MTFANGSKTTDAQVKQSASAYEPYLPGPDDSLPEAAPEYTTPPPTGDAQHTVGTDPTVAHAGLNEDTTVQLPVNGTAAAEGLPTLLQQTTIDAGAANAVAEENWDHKLSGSAEGDGWVEVPRDPTETETGVTATPAAMTSTQSWADDQPAAAPPVSAPSAPAPSAPANNNDGFHEVHHPRGGRGRGGPQGERRGSFRGRGGHRGGGEGGGYRGRGGMRGDRGGEGGRGRGRGGFRGPRGRDGPPAPRRPDDS